MPFGGGEPRDRSMSGQRWVRPRIRLSLWSWFPSRTCFRTIEVSLNMRMSWAAASFAVTVLVVSPLKGPERRAPGGVDERRGRRARRIGLISVQASWRSEWANRWIWQEFLPLHRQYQLFGRRMSEAPPERSAPEGLGLAISRVLREKDVVAGGPRCLFGSVSGYDRIRGESFA